MAIGNVPGFGAVPYASKVALPSNFLTPTDYAYLSPYLGDSDPKLHEVYGSGLITGFIEKMGAVRYTHAQVSRWAEDRRVNNLYTGVTRATNTLTFTAPHLLRIGQDIMIDDGTDLNYAHVTAVPSTTTVTIAPYLATLTVGTTDLIVSDLAGTDFRKGSLAMAEGLNPGFTYKTNTKAIVKETDIVSKTDATEMLWFQVSTPEGSGWLWCHAVNNKGKKRFENAREAKFLIGQKAEAGSGAAAAGVGNMQGLLPQAIAGGINWTGFPADKDDWEEIFTELDKQAGLANYAAWLNTASDFDFSNVIATQTEIGYGMFNNDKAYAYSMDFRGFDIGGYNVYKTKWKFLNDAAGFGSMAGAGKINGLMLPMGSASVYDEETAGNLDVPYVHVDTTRGAKGEDRFYYVDPNGAAPGSDSYKTDYLAEFCAKLVGANNCVVFKS